MDVRRPTPRQPDQFQQRERSAGIFALRFKRYQFAVSYPDRLTLARRYVCGAHGELSPPLLSRRYCSGLPSAKHYDSRYEEKDPVRTSENSVQAKFVEFTFCEVR